MTRRWVGIDCGFSQLSIALIDDSGNVLAVERTRSPTGDGHERTVALDRVLELLPRLNHLRDQPVTLAGYCYDHAGVIEAFQQAGWTVAGVKALNDVVGVYGLTEMRGDVLVCSCGSWSQVVYVDSENNIRWPGDDVAEMLPEWKLSGWAYGKFLVDLTSRNEAVYPKLAQAVHERLGGDPLSPSDGRWWALGPLLSSYLHLPAVKDFISENANAVVKTRDLISRYAGCADPPEIVFGGGALHDDRLWDVLSRELQARGVTARRVQGEPAVGLARYARRHPDADPWSFVGRMKPSWLS